MVSAGSRCFTQITPTMLMLFSVARVRWGVCAMILGGVTPAAAQTARNAVQALPGSTLTIRGSTTIGKKWNCTATDITASATVKPGDQTSPVGAIGAVAVSVPVLALKCQSAAMTRAMVKAMRAEHDSTSVIIGSFSGHPVAEVHAAADTHLDGVLTVAGVQDSVAPDLTVQTVSESMFHIRSILPLRLSSFRITPPRVLFGAIRARDEITVEVDLHFIWP